MKFMLSLLVLGHVALASPVPSLPVHPGGIGGLFKGPSDETIIKGPDGSIITSVAHGGLVQSHLEPIVVAEEVAPIVTGTPVAVAATPVAPVVEAVAVPVSPVENRQSSDLIGPSGRILTQGSQSVIAGPASTTVTGPAVVAETIVKGPPIVAAPILNVGSPALSTVTATPLPVITGSIAPVAVTSAGISPISVTASPLSLPGTLRIIPTSLLSDGNHVSITGGPVGTAIASASPHVSVASASASQGATATAAVSPNTASAVVQTSGRISTVTSLPLPLIPSSVAPGIHEVGVHGLVSVNNQIDLTSHLIHDQLAVDNRQLSLGPVLIPAANLLPPEIAVTPKTIVGRLRPTPGTLLTTPGLGSVATSTNIQRGEADISLNVTPNPVHIIPQHGLTQQQALALQNRQNLLNNQIQHAEQAADPGLAYPNSQLVGIQSRDDVFLNTNADSRLIGNGHQFTSLANVQQHDLLSAELAKVGIDASQLQLANIPLSDVSGLPVGISNADNLRGSPINHGLAPEAWARYGRKADSKQN